MRFRLTFVVIVLAGLATGGPSAQSKELARVFERRRGRIGETADRSHLSPLPLHAGWPPDAEVLSLVPPVGILRNGRPFQVSRRKTPRANCATGWETARPELP